MTNSEITQDWVAALDKWAGWLRASRKEPGTIYQRLYHVKRLAIATPAGPWSVTLDHLSEWMGNQNVGSNTLRSRRSSVVTFYAWAFATKRIQDNPAALLPKVKAAIGKPRPAPAGIADALRFARDTRVPLMVDLGLLAGLRCCEICRVHGDDVRQDFVGWSLTAHGKGDKQRVIPITDELAQRIRERAAGGWLFPGQIDGHLSAAYVSKLISRHLPPGVTAHPLRHRFASRAYANGGKDIRAVQELLGHASVATTQIYTAVDDEALRRAALAAA